MDKQYYNDYYHKHREHILARNKQNYKKKQLKKLNIPEEYGEAYYRYKHVLLELPYIQKEIIDFFHSVYPNMNKTKN